MWGWTVTIGYHNWQGNLDLLNIIMIGISDILPEHDNIYEMHRLLSALFSEKLSAAEKIDIILNMYKNNFTVEQIALATQHKVDEVKEIIKNN